MVAGGAVGIVSLLLVRSSEALQEATDELVAERERAARLAERESMARQIHDSVLQALALIHKKGRELARLDRIPPGEVERLSDLARKEEAELRGLILRDPQPQPPGLVSLRAEVESIARTNDIEASVGSVGPIWIDRHVGLEVAAAVRQALANVAKHGRATKATVFAEEDDGRLVVSVRDDGIGFVFDEDALRAAGKVGILKSMKGRVEDLGGSMIVTSAPGKGTEIEFVIPLEER
jgi:signal transduction histidine kinase